MKSPNKLYRAQLIDYSWVTPGVRVTVTGTYRDSTKAEKHAIGHSGRIVGYAPDFSDVQYFSQIPVEFDTEAKDRHSCRQLGKDKHCLYIPAMFLQQEAHHEDDTVSDPKAT